jgi:hypothetical protein
MLKKNKVWYQVQMLNLNALMSRSNEVSSIKSARGLIKAYRKINAGKDYEYRILRIEVVE